MTRPRYDTELLVSEIKRERRNAILLVFSGFAILSFLAFYFTRMGDSSVPNIPDAGHTTVAAKPAPAPAVAPVAPPKPVEPPPPPVVDPAITVALGKPTALWIDEKLVGNKVRDHSSSLLPGKHVLKVKFGKKAVEQTIAAEAGMRYVATLDLKRKKWSVEASLIGPVASAKDATPKKSQ